MNSTPAATPTELDPDRLALANLAVFQVKQGEMLALMLHLGHRLGLFEALAAVGEAVDSAAIAERADVQERWAREWLYAVAAGGLVEHTEVQVGDSHEDRFSLTAEMAAVLADPDHPAFAAPVFQPPMAPATVDRLAEAFRTGIGFSWGDHGEHTAHMQAAMSGGGQRHFLVPVVIDSIEGLTERLRSGIQVIDVGCGSGVALCTMAEAFPESQFHGIDPSAPAIAAARRRAAEAGLDNVEFGQETFDALQADEADLVLTLDVLHDLPHPVEAVRAVERALAPDGVWLLADIKAESSFAANRKNPVLALFYAMSVAFCMNSALSEPDGAGLGTLGLHPERLRGMLEGAGFGSIEFREFPHDVSTRYAIVRH